jgi:hypothetical protein
MESQLFTLSKIFTERLFRIPDYQRGYAWTEPQLIAFWNDLSQLDDSTNHYTGVLTLETVSESQRSTWHDDSWIIESKKYEPLFVVDGQQRLTTSIILIQCIIECISENERLNYTSKADIQKKFIFDLREEGVSRSYIFGYEVDNPSYEFLKTQIFGEFSSTSKSEETIYTNNLEYAKNFFAEKLKAMKKNEIEAIYRKLTQQLLFNIFSISDEVDVCVAFETMNNRGKPLSELELLKNRLIYLSLKIDEPVHERAKLRRSINDCWKAIYHNLGRNKKRPLDDDLFLSCHYLLYFTEPKKDQDKDPLSWRQHRFYMSGRRATSSYKTLLDDIFVTKRVVPIDGSQAELNLASIYQYVSALQPAVEKWYQIFDPSVITEDDSVRAWMDKLDRLQIETHLPLKLAILLCKDANAEKAELLKRLEHYTFAIFLFQHAHYGYPGFNDFLPEAIQLYRGEITAKQLARIVSDALSKAMTSPNLLSEVRKNFRGSGFYNWKAIRYFMYEYNLHLQSRSKTSRKKLDWSDFNEKREDFITIEHVFPQNARARYWTDRFSGLTPQQRRQLIHSLGNLAPLSKAKNSSLSNKPFPEKVSGERDAVVGFRFGCYVENEISLESEWTKEVILERGLKLLNFLEKRWSVQLGDTDEKITMLGLDFMEHRRK